MLFEDKMSNYFVSNKVSDLKLKTIHKSVWSLTILVTMTLVASYENNTNT